MNFGLYHRFTLQAPEDMNAALQEGFLRLLDSAYVQQSHYFAGRFENIYVKDDHLPALTALKDRIRTLAAELLDIQNDLLTIGCWFNAMGPGEATQRHCHDDYDELLSGVYYIAVPFNSGRLILHGSTGARTVEPRVGDGVFFRPDLEHEVSPNKSDQLRLAIGFNIGPAKAVT